MSKRCFIIGAGEFDGFPKISEPPDNAEASGKVFPASGKNDMAKNTDLSTIKAEQATQNNRNIFSLIPESSDLIIAADGGYRYLQTLGIEPDILMGDFDSLEIVPEHRHLIRHSPIKDDTDMALAAAWGEEAGYDTFFLYGGLGGRLDHTIANLQLLTGMARKGLIAYLVGQHTIITAITDGGLHFSAQAKGMISVFCQGEQASGVFEHGLKYTLENAVLTCDRALGVSNEFIGVPGSIEVKSGTLLVMWDASNGLPQRSISVNVLS